MTPDLKKRLVELAKRIQQIPAPTFSEARRADFVHQRFLAEGLEDVSVDPVGNVYARLAGSGTAPPLVISAHLDTVFPEHTDLALSLGAGRVAGPGIGDNATGVAGLFGLLWGLRGLNATLNRDLWLVANVGEEGLGDLCGMRAVVDRFGAQTEAYIILEGMALGQIYHRGLGVQRYRITFETEGGHSWVDYGKPSAVHELGLLVSQLAALKLPDSPRTSLNVGMISGGTSINTIAPSAYLDLDLRSEDPETLSGLVARVEAMVAAFDRPEVRVKTQIIGQRPAGEIPAEHPLVRQAVEVLMGLGITARLNIGSTDANIPLSRGLPAICIGLTNGGGAHTLREYIQTSPLGKGLEQLIRLVRALCS